MTCLENYMHKCHHTMIAVFLRIAVRQILSKMDKRHQCHPFQAIWDSQNRTFAPSVSVNQPPSSSFWTCPPHQALDRTTWHFQDLRSVKTKGTMVSESSMVTLVWTIIQGAERKVEAQYPVDCSLDSRNFRCYSSVQPPCRPHSWALPWLLQLRLNPKE